MSVLSFMPLAALLVDTYKIGMPQLHNRVVAPIPMDELNPEACKKHANGWKSRIRKSYSNFTPRKIAYMKFCAESDQRLVSFGIQAAIKYIVEAFEDTFFSGNWSEDIYPVLVDHLRSHFGGNVEVDHAVFLNAMEELHELGHLPVQIRAIPEGTRYPVGLPLFTTKSTHEEFSWTVNHLETIISCLVFPMVNGATKMEQFYLQAKAAANESIPPELHQFWLPWAVHNFEMRGMFGPEHALRSGATSALAFAGSDTIASQMFLEHYYLWDVKTAAPALGSVRATEHADITRLLSEYRAMGFINDTEYYVLKEIAETSDGIVSYVADSENYYRTLNKYARMLKDVILGRKDRSDGQPAKFVFRPDSSRRTPLTVICGYNIIEWSVDQSGKYACFPGPIDVKNAAIKTKEGKYYLLDVKSEREIKDGYEYKVECEIEEVEALGSLRVLWDVFGGSEWTNSAGKTYKLLNPKVGLIYGEAISQLHQREIYDFMHELGFSAYNLIIGKGSYAALENNTRDLFSMSYKQTFSETDIDGEIFNLEMKKKPMGDISKESASGLLAVSHNVEDDTYQLHQNVTEEEEANSVLEIIYNDGNLHLESWNAIYSRYREQLAALI